MQKHRAEPSQPQLSQCRWCHQSIYCRRKSGGQSIYCHQAQHIKRPGESDSHLQGKRFLKQFFQKQGAHVENEVYYPHLRQRPDVWVMWPNQFIWAIEYQCAYLTYAQFLKRTQVYQSVNLPVFWILGANYLGKIPYAVLHLESQGLGADYSDGVQLKRIHFNGQQACVRQQQCIYPQRLLQKIRQGVQQHRAPYRQLQQRIYLCGGNLLHMPAVCLPTTYLPVGPRSPHWFIYYELWLLLHEQAQSYTELLGCVAEIPWHQSVYIDERKWQAFVLTEMLQAWFNAGVIVTVADQICLAKR